MLSTCREKTTAGSKTVGLEVERAVRGSRLERGKVGLLDLKTTDKEHLIFDAGMLE